MKQSQKELLTYWVNRAYKAGMMQGIRICQTKMSLSGQQELGLTEHNGKLNDLLEEQSNEFYNNTAKKGINKL